MLEYRNKRELILPYKKHALDHAIAQVMYEKGDVSIILRYNYQTQMIEGLYRYQIYQLSLLWVCQYFAPYADINNMVHSLVPELRVSKPTDINDNIQILRDSLYPNMFLTEPWVKSTRAKFFHCAYNAKTTIREKAVKQQYEASFKFACERAASAFLERDYKRVIQLLQPYEQELTLSDKKKLDLAKRQILMQ